MNKLKNEKGAALVLTLMIITLFLVFITVQFYQITNTTKQVSTTEKQIDARLIAEMGVDYYRGRVNNVNEGEQSIEEFMAKLPVSVTKNIDDDRSFAVDARIDASAGDRIIIHYTSTGRTTDDVTSEVTGTITIRIEGGEK
ncbi:hypothetical protein EU245_01675 [Lentibacillus lipolyticus]|nr:hypothetical protein EU245_01675 [Lentibacillus lipolyticus]